MARMARSESRPRRSEAIEAILINGSRVRPKVAFLKPISSAISIGSGGPFGWKADHHDRWCFWLHDRAAFH
jgi:H+/Cl- antiporter ClcA